MHFDFTLNLANVTAIVVALTAIWRVEQLLNWFILEHEVLVLDYCERKGIEINQLPTRTSKSRGHD